MHLSCFSHNIPPSVIFFHMQNEKVVLEEMLPILSLCIINILSYVFSQYFVITEFFFSNAKLHVHLEMLQSIYHSLKKVKYISLFLFFLFLCIIKKEFKQLFSQNLVKTQHSLFFTKMHVQLELLVSVPSLERFSLAEFRGEYGRSKVYEKF